MSREAMKQALEAWDAYDGGTLDHFMSESMEALRTAIEQAERDWSLLEATQASLREHMAEIKRLQQRQWIGLTDEEVHQGFCHVEYETPNDWNTDPDDWCQQFARYLEAKLKEKNT
jgi:Tfp pilus assembly protein PilN